MQTLKLIFFAGLGGFFGSALRYLTGKLFAIATFRGGLLWLIWWVVF